MRLLTWGKRTRKKLTSIPKLEYLPSTTEIFLINVLRAHYQACIWNSSLQPRPGNGLMSGKMSYYRIRVSLVFSEFLAIHIYFLRNWTLKKKKKKKKKCLLDYFLAYSVILLNLHPCVKHGNLFYFIMSAQVHKMSACVFLLLLPLIFFKEF